MTAIRTVLAYLREATGHHRRARRLLPGAPDVIRLTYLRGHPGMARPASVWVGRVGDRLRLVDLRARRWHDLPLARIHGVSCEPQGRLCVRFEPTAGLLSTVEFRAEGSAPERLSRLLDMVGA